MNPESLLLELFRRERGRLWGFFVRGCGSREEAEDLLQDLFLRLWDHRADLGEEAAARAYLWRAARNHMIDAIRRNVRRRALGLNDGPPADLTASRGPGPDCRIEHDDCLQVLRETVDRLPNERARRCLQLWLQGEGVLGIAAELSIGVGQVRGLLQRGKSEVIMRATDRLRARTSLGASE